MHNVLALALLLCGAAEPAPAPVTVKLPDMRGNLPVLDGGTPVCGAVLLSPRILLTAAHCADSDLDIQCLGKSIPAQLMARSADEDLSLMLLDEDCGAPITHIAKDNPSVGTDVYAVGFPTSQPRMSRGIVSGYETMSVPEYDKKQHEPKAFLATDVAADPGSSGGGLFNTRGELVGICTMSRGHFMYYSPPSRIWRFLAAVAAAK